MACTGGPRVNQCFYDVGVESFLLVPWGTFFPEVGAVPRKGEQAFDPDHEVF